MALERIWEPTPSSQGRYEGSRWLDSRYSEGGRSAGEACRTRCRKLDLMSFYDLVLRGG
jgi:hypothetical protein